MSVVPLKTYQQVKHRVRVRIETNKLRHARYYQLVGSEAKTAVLEGCVVRLLKPDAVFPYALRKRLNPKKFGNITLRNTDPTLWKAWINVYENYIKGGKFFYEKSAATDNLIDLAVDAERGDYCKATAESGDIDPELLERLSEAGQVYARTPEREHEHEKRVEDYDAAKEQLRQDIEAEFAKMIPALKEYVRTRKCKKQQRAFRLIWAGTAPGEPKMLGKDIALRCDISEPTVSKLRAKFDEMTEKFFDLYNTAPEEGASTPDTPDATIDVNLHDEPEVLYAVDVDKKGDTAKLSGVLSLEPVQGAVDPGDYSENVAGSYARNKSAERVTGGGGGRRTYDEQELVTGGSGGKKATYAERVEMSKPAERVDRANFNKRFADTAARHLQRKARESGYNIDGALQIIDEHISQKYAEVAALIEVRRAEVLRIAKLPELAWIEPWCEEKQVSPGDLLGSTDLTLSAMISGPKESDQ